MTWWDRTNRWADAHRFAVDAAGTGLALVVVVPLTRALSWQASGAGGVGLWAFLLVSPVSNRIQTVKPTRSLQAINI